MPLLLSIIGQPGPMSVGFFKIVFPLQEQTLSKSVRIEKEGYLPRLRVDECPDAKNLTPYPMRKNT